MPFCLRRDTAPKQPLLPSTRSGLASRPRDCESSAWRRGLGKLESRDRVRGGESSSCRGGSKRSSQPLEPDGHDRAHLDQYRAGLPFPSQPAKPKKSSAPLFHASTRRLVAVSSTRAYHLFRRLFGMPRTACELATAPRDSRWEDFLLPYPSSAPLDRDLRVRPRHPSVASTDLPGGRGCPGRWRRRGSKAGFRSPQ